MLFGRGLVLMSAEEHNWEGQGSIALAVVTVSDTLPERTPAGTILSRQRPTATP